MPRRPPYKANLWRPQPQTDTDTNLRWHILGTDGLFVSEQSSYLPKVCPVMAEMRLLENFYHCL